METWKTDSITDVLPEEFYGLIDRNREHIAKSFPVTLSACGTLALTTAYMIQAAENMQKGLNHYFYLRHIATDSLIGWLLIKNIDRRIDKCELAYFIDKNFEGQGIITKAVANLVAFCFGPLGMNKVIICASPVNFGSQRVAHKNGFTQEGILREEFKNGNGILEDVVCFGLLKSEY
jgi:RimJ/RimL family protein N-acetyltransferase